MKAPLRFALETKWHCMRAVILRDMRTRFFNHGLGFILAPLWPLAHMIILLTVYRIAGRAAPYGDTLDIFFAPALITFLTYLYVSRFMATSVLMNRPLLSLPVVHITDILFARAILETLSACAMMFLTLMFLVARGVDIASVDYLDALGCFAVCLVFAIGVGMLVALMAMINRLFMVAYALTMVAVYISSGIFFVPSALPAQLTRILKWDPWTQQIEWMRTAFIAGYPQQLVDRRYSVFVALSVLLLGLVVERLLRGRLRQK